jgi:predicted permease
MNGWPEQFLQDLQFALRTLRKNPGFTAVAVLSLALGIGANTAIFSVVNAVLLKSLPVADPASLVLFSHQGKGGAPDKPAQWVNFPFYEFLRDGNRSFSAVVAFSLTHLRVRRGAETEGVAAQWVTPNYFSTLGVRATLGRTWSADDDAHPELAVISDRFWRGWFAADPAVIGKTLVVAGRPVTIVGVVPPEFLGLRPGTPIDLTMLLAAQPEFQPERGNLLTLGRGAKDEPMPTWELYAMGRLKPGVTTTQAEAEASVLLRQWTSSRGASPAYVGSSYYRAEFLPGGKGLDALRQRFSAPLRVLAGIVGCVFLIACANNANLQLARAAARRHELAVRTAIGASRGRLVRQLLTESFTLTALGGAAGMLVGWWGSATLVALLGSGRTPVELQADPDVRVLGFTLGLSILAGLGVGLVPAWRASRPASTQALKETGAGGRRRMWRWSLSQVLVMAQLALSLCLLVGTGLFAANLRRIAAIEPGFRADNLLSVSFDWAGAGYTKPQMITFAERAVARAQEVAGVQSASATHVEPLGDQQSQRWFSARGATPGVAITSVVDLNVVSAGYFATMNLPLARGREFDRRDTATSPHVAIISESLARACFGDADPVGDPVWIARNTEGAPWTVVGVARDMKQRDLREAPLHLLYLPTAQSAAWEMNLVVRTAGNPLALAPELRRAMASVSPDVAVRDITTPQIQMERSLLQERLLATLSNCFGPLALLLAAIGLYGLLAYDVNRRTREIGVRLALGARHADVLRLVLKQGLLLVSVGTLAGLAAASSLAGVLRRFLSTISPNDPGTFAAAAAVLAVVALLACWLPARRAAKVDPMVALRTE